MGLYRKVIEKALQPDDKAQASSLGLPCISMVSDTALYVEGHRGIRTYESDLIQLSVKTGMISVRGSNLAISAFSKERIKIKGRIDGIDIERSPK